MKNLDKIVLESVEKGMSALVDKEIGGYNSPLKPIVQQVVQQHEAKIALLLSSAMDSFLSSKKFKEEIDNVMMKKLAQQMLAKMSAEISSTVDKIQAKNPVFKQEIEVAVSKIIKAYE